MQSLARIITIGRVTLLEAIRQQVLTVILFIGLGMVVAVGMLGGYVPSEQIKFVKDVCSGAMTYPGIAIAILSTAMLIPQELQNRTIYTILAKPVRRGEFLFGKFLGVVLLITFATLLLSLVAELALYAQEIRSLYDVDQEYTRVPNWQQNRDLLSAYQKDRDEVISQVQNPQLFYVVILIYMHLLLIATIALFFSTFASSYLFTVIVTLMVYFIGCLESVARGVWLGNHAPNELATYFLGLVSMLVPDFSIYIIVDEITAGHNMPFMHIANLVGYSLTYMIVLLAASEVIFRNREI